MSEILTGRCLCGAIHFRCGPVLYPPTLCHCESCQRASGAPAVAWLTVKASDLAYSGDAPREFASSADVVRTFCGRCGTPLTYRNTRRADEIDITVCSLDDPDRAAPTDHIWIQDAPRWERHSADLPRHPQGRHSS
jgi:hypothetical protein